MGAIRTREFLDLLSLCTKSSFAGLSSEPLGIALSGGVDSMALCSLLVDHFPADRLHAFTVDHGLRPESREEAYKVQANTQSLGVDHEILSIPTLPNHGVEQHARHARYEALTNACLRRNIKNLFLAHHADDQVETMLIRMLQGSSWKGLKAMESYAHNPLSHELFGGYAVKLCRPLLHVSKSRLKATCLARNVSWFEDATNQDASLTIRNAVRSVLKDSQSLPLALRPAPLLKTNSELVRLHDRGLSLESEVVRQSNVQLSESIASLQFSVMALLDKLPTMESKISMIEKLARMVSPVSKIDASGLYKVLVLFEQQTKSTTEAQISAAGLIWRIRGEQCLIMRQPFKRDETAKFALPLPDRKWVKWDNRFWIKITSANSWAVRAMHEFDMYHIRKKVAGREKKVLESLLALAPGKVRFTLPVIVNQQDQVVSLPSLGYSFLPTLEVDCKVVGRYLLERWHGEELI